MIGIFVFFFFCGLVLFFYGFLAKKIWMMVRKQNQCCSLWLALRVVKFVIHIKIGWIYLVATQTDTRSTNGKSAALQVNEKKNLGCNYIFNISLYDCFFVNFVVVLVVVVCLKSIFIWVSFQKYKPKE